MPRSTPAQGPAGRWRRASIGTLLLAASACAREPALPNFILVSVDTLRADHLGAYGYPRDTSPQIDRFAARSVRYANAFAPAPWTLPSHVALLTGRHPLDVGIRDLRSAIPDGIATLAELLRGAGFATAAFVDSRPRGFVGAERGFARGFDSFVHEPTRAAGGFRDDMAATVDAALAWLERRDPARPFFLFLHTKSVHTKRVHRWALDPAVIVESDAPYDKPGPWHGRFLAGGRTHFAWHDPDEPEVAGARYLARLNERFAAGDLEPGALEPARLDELVALYDAGIAYVDLHFGRLLDGLAEQGLDDRTVVVLTSDHGESFLERRLFLHLELHPETLRVPLILRDPEGPQGAVVQATVGLVDVAPTLLARAGLPAPGGLAGRPLPLSDAGVPPRDPELSYYHLEDGYLYEGAALREGSWKLLLHRWRGEPALRADLYDLRSDPGERSPVGGEPERVRAMRERLEARLAEGDAALSRSIEVPAEMREELRALGYGTE
jgi:arylsulfatase A-like enzyme